jgi:hypothetical protein
MPPASSAPSQEKAHPSNVTSSQGIVGPLPLSQQHGAQSAVLRIQLARRSRVRAFTVRKKRLPDVRVAKLRVARDFPR